MPKNSDKEPAPNAASNGAAHPSETDAPAAKKRAGGAKKKSAPAAARKKTASPTSRKRAASKKPKVKYPTDAEIRTRAYFIAERRVQLALEGDPALDWIEARQQLIAEARQGR